VKMAELNLCSSVWTARATGNVQRATSNGQQTTASIDMNDFSGLSSVDDCMNRWLDDNDLPQQQKQKQTRHRTSRRLCKKLWLRRQLRWVYQHGGGRIAHRIISYDDDDDDDTDAGARVSAASSNGNWQPKHSIDDRHIFVIAPEIMRQQQQQQLLTKCSGNSKRSRRRCSDLRRVVVRHTELEFNNGGNTRDYYNSPGGASATEAVVIRQQQFQYSSCGRGRIRNKYDTLPAVVGYRVAAVATWNKRSAASQAPTRCECRDFLAKRGYFGGGDCDGDDRRRRYWGGCDVLRKWRQFSRDLQERDVAVAEPGFIYTFVRITGDTDITLFLIDDCIVRPNWVVSRWELYDDLL
jgi:hypothetical protein